MADAGELRQPLVEDLRQRERGALEDEAADRGREHDDREHPHERPALDRRGAVPGCGLRALPPAAAFGRPDSSSRPQEDGVGDADADGDHPGQHERVAPPRGVDEVAGEEGRARHPEVPEDPVDRERHPRLRSPLDDEGEADRMVDRGEETDGGEPERDLERRPREGGQDRARSDAEEEDHDHPFPAPLVREPAGGDRGHPEGDEARRRVGDEGRVAHPPLVGEPERRDGREDEHEEVVEEVPDVQEEKAETGTRHGGFLDVGQGPGRGPEREGPWTATLKGSSLSHRVRPRRRGLRRGDALAAASEVRIRHSTRPLPGHARSSEPDRGMPGARTSRVHGFLGAPASSPHAQKARDAPRGQDARAPRRAAGLRAAGASGNGAG